MGYIIAYLLFAVVVDLLLEIVGLKGPRQGSHVIHRRLWSDTLFDCRSSVFSADVAATHVSGQGKPNRYRLRKEPCVIASGGS